MVYLDNAATSFPKPPQVVRAMAGVMEKIGANPGRSGHQLSLAAGRVVENCRETLARYLQVDDPSRIVFTKNCTEALNMAIHGFVRAGDHVVTSLLEHNSVLRPLCELARLNVISLSFVTPGPQGRIDPREVERLFTPATRLCVLSHASNVLGVVQDMAAIARVCHAHGVRLLADAAQSAGTHDVRPSALGADLLAMPGHKGLLGPHGTGALYIAPGIQLAPMVQGGTGSVSESMFQPMDLPDRFESGTLNLPGIAGLLCGVRFVMREGEERARNLSRISACIYEGLHDMRGVRVYSPPGTNVISLNVNGLSSGETAGMLSGAGIAVRGGLHCAPAIHRHLGTLETGAVRVSPGVFNTPRDADTFLKAMRVITAGRA